MYILGCVQVPIMDRLTAITCPLPIRELQPRILLATDITELGAWEEAIHLLQHNA